MLQGQYTKYLRNNEVLIAAIRRSLWGYAGQITATALLVVFTSFVSIPLMSGPILLNVLFGLLVVVAIWSVVRFGVMYLHDVLLVTDTRIIDIDQRGIIIRTVSDTTYDRITDITWGRSGWWEWLTGCGGITLATAGSSSQIEIRPVRHPQQVHELIREVMEIVSDTNNTDATRISRIRASSV